MDLGVLLPASLIQSHTVQRKKRKEKREDGVRDKREIGAHKRRINQPLIIRTQMRVRNSPPFADAVCTLEDFHRGGVVCVWVGRHVVAVHEGWGGGVVDAELEIWREG